MLLDIRLVILIERCGSGIGTNMRNRTEYHDNGKVKSVIYYLGDKEFDQIFYDENGEFERHIMLYDYGIREDYSRPLF